LDLPDVRSGMAGAGAALMGIGSSRGDDRSVAAAEMAISSPLLESSIDGAHGVLLSIQGGSDLGLFEINEAAQLVSNSAAPDANFIFGAVIDDALGDEVRVTVIAAGLGDNRGRGALPEPTARVLSGRRESNGRATVSAGHHSGAPGYQAAAVASPGPAASGGQLADPPDGAASPLGWRNGHAPAPAGPGAADPGGAGQAGSASQAAGAGAAET